jgi:transposase
MLTKGLNVKRTWGSAEKISALIKKEKDARLKERLQAVLWRLKNDTYTNISKRLGRHIDTVREWIKKWNKAGYEGLKDDPKSGRATILTTEETNTVIQQVNTIEKQGQITCKSIAKEIEDKFNKEISPDAVRTMLLKHGISWKKPEKVDYRRDEKRRNAFLEEFSKKNIQIA